MRAAVIPSKGIGDGLIMMVASYRLKKEGYQVTTFHDALGELEDWFPGQLFAKRFDIGCLDTFDRIILQNENTPFAFDLISQYRKKIYVLYASYEKEKHHPLTNQDVLFNRSEPMVKGVARAISAILGKHDVLQENGLEVPQGIFFQKDHKRVVIHPMGTLSSRMWTAEKFISVATALQKEEYIPAFCVSSSERERWTSLLQERFLLPKFSNLSALARYLYESHILIGNESGVGHLASNLGVPTLIVARNPQEMALWRPGFRLGKVITPPRYIPNLKGMRLRDKKWQAWISPRAVLQAFQYVSHSL